MAGIVLALSTKAYVLAFLQAVPAMLAIGKIYPLHRMSGKDPSAADATYIETMKNCYRFGVRRQPVPFKDISYSKRKTKVVRPGSELTVIVQLIDLARSRIRCKPKPDCISTASFSS